MKVTLRLGDPKEVEVKSINVKDLWHIAMARPKDEQEMILDVWHLCHDLKRNLQEIEPKVDAVPDLLKALITIAGVKLSCEGGGRLDKSDAQGFVMIARKALKSGVLIVE